MTSIFEPSHGQLAKRRIARGIRDLTFVVKKGDDDCACSRERQPNYLKVMYVNSERLIIQGSFGIHDYCNFQWHKSISCTMQCHGTVLHVYLPDSQYEIGKGNQILKGVHSSL